MIKFHLDFTPKSADFTVHHGDALFFIGSCFSEEIGGKFKDYLYEVTINPNGNLFNPLSIHTSLNSILNLTEFDVSMSIEREKLYYSYLHHSQFSETSLDKLVNRINDTNQQANTSLKTCNYLFITFGTAFYYYHLNLQLTVANCHKQPASTFEKCLATPANIVSKYNELIPRLLAYNPNLKIIFTVSPVKHLRDGVIENTLSKSNLIASVHEIVKNFTNCYYFPAYELVTDDLRDYRFYESDLAHPNKQAVDYVWEKLSNCYLDEKGKLLHQKVAQYLKAKNHRMLQPNPTLEANHRHYLYQLQQEIVTICPAIEF